MSEQSRPAVPERVTLPLLTLITQQSLDEDYRHVAERRGADSRQPPRGRPHRTAAVVVAVFGILVTTAAVQTSRNSGISDTSRTTLVSQIVAGRESVSKMQTRIVKLRERNVGLDGQLSQLTRTEQSSVTRLRRLEVRTGYVAVTGPGVRIVVDDAPNGDATQLVRDEDLAKLVDGLWSAGAEAISINGQRLSTLSAIRNVGAAVHVNGLPVSPPYTVQAIGNTQNLQSKLLDSTHGQEWFSLVDQLGFVFSMHNEDQLSLPAARMRQLRSVVSGTAQENRDTRMSEETKP